MSRHGKRLSVFDRLGPGNDEELTPPHSSSTSGSRHRHYPPEKHERSHLTLSSDRDKRISDTPGDRSRKHRDDVDTTPVDNRSAKREKVAPTLRKDMKVVKPPLRSTVCERRDEPTDDQARLKRKRERESLSDSESSHHRETKRLKTESSLERHHSHKDTSKPKDLDNITHPPPFVKKKPSDTFYEPEQQSYKSEIDWSVLSSIPCPKPLLKMISLERHRSGAIFTDIGVSLSLAGPILGQKVLDSVRQHLQNNYQDTSSELLNEPFGGYSLAGLGTSHLRTGMKNHKQFDIGTCRRALTAEVDFMMRKKCLQKFGPKGNEFAGCFEPYYPASMRLYKN